MIILSPNLVLNENLEEDLRRRFGPWIGYDNLYRVGITSASSESVGGERQNAYETGLTYDFWNPGAVGENWIAVSFPTYRNCDYAALAAHDIFQQGGTIKFQYDVEDDDNWLDATGWLTVANGRPLMAVFDNIQAKGFRWLISGTNNPVSIGVAVCGKLLRMPRGLAAGYRPPYFNRNITFGTPVSERNTLLGRTEVAAATKLSVSIDDLSSEFIRNEFSYFVESAINYPFFFVARDTQEFEVFYGEATTLPSSYWGRRTHMVATIEALGIV